VGTIFHPVAVAYHGIRCLANLLFEQHAGKHCICNSFDIRVPVGLITDGKLLTSPPEDPHNECLKRDFFFRLLQQ
jgi:hypothetical protein